MNDTILKSGLRAFFISLCKWIGFFCGVILLFVLIDTLSSTSDHDLKIETSYRPEIIPNAQGVRKELSSSAPVILRLDIVGEIGKTGLTSEVINQQLVESREGALKNNRVKGVLVFINTPGGSGFDSDGIYRALKRYKELYKVPVYGYIDSLCASGGMYVAAGCDKVFSSNASLIGNIGVITSPFFNISKPMETYGVESLTLHAGKDKDELNPFRPWKKDEAANLQDMINFFYVNFISIVTNSRPKINAEQLVKEYGAKIFTAPEALEIGMIDDANSTESQVLELLAKEIGAEDSNYQVVRLRDSNIFKALFNSRSPLVSGLWKFRFLMPGEQDLDKVHTPLLLYHPQIF